jgi:hypothetical protein
MSDVVSEDPTAPKTGSQAYQQAVGQEPILRFFEYSHLPPHLQSVSGPFGELAIVIMKLPRSAERTVALRKLLESKDAAVRAALPADGALGFVQGPDGSVSAMKVG